MINSISFVVNLHIYPYKVLFAFNQTDEDVYSQLRKLRVGKKEIGDSHIIDKSSGIAVTYTTSQRALIRMNKMPKENYYKGTLAHEIDHVANDILNAIGMYRTNASEEAYTYLIGYITSQAYAKLRGAHK